MRKDPATFFRSTGILCLLLFATFFALAHTRVAGKVMDAPKEHLERVAVGVKNATFSTIIKTNRRVRCRVLSRKANLPFTVALTTSANVIQS
jgi:hypothetical protein